jgi:hypothetical protein
MGLACWAAQEEEGREESWAAAQKQRGSSSLFFPKTVFLYFVSNFFCYLKSV